MGKRALGIPLVDASKRSMNQRWSSLGVGTERRSLTLFSLLLLRHCLPARKQRQESEFDLVAKLAQMYPPYALVPSLYSADSIADSSNAVGLYQRDKYTS